MEFKLLAGYNTQNKEIIIFDVKVDENKVFTLSANIGQMFNINEYTLEDCIEFISDFDLTDLFERYNVDIEDIENITDDDKYRLMESILDTDYDSIPYRFITDCSCTEYELYDNENTYNFNTVACGQCCDELDSFDFKLPYAEELKSLWEAYHLERLPDNYIEALTKVYDEAQKLDIYSQLENIFIKGE